MKLLNFVVNSQQKLGIWTSQGIIDVAAAGGPVDGMEVIAGGEPALKDLAELVYRYSGPYVDESAITWAPSVTRPGKILCIGLNYRKHAEETGADIPEYPVLFNKLNNALTAHQSNISVPDVTSKIDYEAELAIVIGKKAKDVSRERALEYVFGYSTANDLSARDLQRRTSQWLLGKSLDSFAPLGPYLVTADEVGNPNNLYIRTTVNGAQRQNSNTSDMIFPCDELVSYLSQYMTLEPGDVILTGTPEGVVLGYPPEQQVYLHAGDTVTVEVEKLGALTNQFV